MKVKLFVTGSQNYMYFKNKLPTRRWDYCETARTVTIVPDPVNVYQDGEYGFVTVFGRKIFVKCDGSHWEIVGAEKSKSSTLVVLDR